MADYPPPVDQLITLGNPGAARQWRDYLHLGLGPEHIPDLIRMATDPALNKADSESPTVWAPLHAWRALGQLRAAEAVTPLLALLQRQDEDDQFNDWVQGDLPKVFGMIGPAAVPVLAAFLADDSHGTYARAAAADGLQEIARAHPETRDACVASISSVLEMATANDPTLNGFLLSTLLDLAAVEAAPVIERAFAAGAVDEGIAGDWEEVQWELGLTDTPPQREAFGSPLPLFPGGLGYIERPPRDHQAKAKAKAKRKQAAKSRKRNRKRR
jgi:Protein of unknown function (DUF1186)